MSPTKKLFFLILTVLLSSTVMAEEFTTEFSPEQQTINQDEIALYNVTIYHNYPSVEFFAIYSPEVLWDIRTKEALQIQPATPFKTTLTIQPLNINPGLYGVPIHVKRTGTNEIKKAILYMEVLGSPTTLTYLPAIRGTIEIQEFVDPREDVVITVNLVNQNRRDLTEIDVKMRSDVINQDFKASLGPLERKTAKFTAQIDPQTPPQQDTLEVTIISTEGDEAFVFDLPPVNYAITSYGQLTPTIALDEAFLKTSRLITIVNDANVVIAEPFAYPLPWYARWFTRTNPKARTEQGRFVWDIALNVGHSSELQVTTNYRPLAAAILLAGILMVMYLLFRSPLVIRKSATVVSTREGGISELKVLLEVKNRSGKPIHHTNIVDLVPRIAELIKDNEVGTIAPSKTIRHEKKGTIVKYEVGDILPFEERVISYRLKSSLSILGGVSLPVAVARFTTATGKERSTSSNAASITFLG